MNFSSHFFLTCLFCSKHLLNMTNNEFLDQHLEQQYYNPRMRPNFLTKINISILILSVTSPDESSVTYEIGFVMRQSWVDPRLKFVVPDALITDPNLYLNGLTHRSKIWTPDTFFIKHGEFKPSTDHLDPSHITMKIYPNGTIFYATRQNMIITCEGNLPIFPFDSPRCSFGIESGEFLHSLSSFSNNSFLSNT